MNTRATPSFNGNHRVINHESRFTTTNEATNKVSMTTGRDLIIITKVQKINFEQPAVAYEHNLLPLKVRIAAMLAC